MLVLFAYGRMISRDRRPHVDELVVFRGAPYDILSVASRSRMIHFHTGPSTTPAFMYHGQLQAAAETLAVGFHTPPSNRLIIRCAGLQEALDKVDARRAQKPSTWLRQGKDRSCADSAKGP